MHGPLSPGFGPVLAGSVPGRRPRLHASASDFGAVRDFIGEVRFCAIVATGQSICSLRPRDP